MTASNGRAGGFAVFRPVRAGNAFEETVEQLLRAVKLGAVEGLPGGLEDTLIFRRGSRGGAPCDGGAS